MSINKGKDNFYMHGFFIGLCTLPTLALEVHWYAILIYSVVLALWMGIGCALTDKDWVEEMICRGLPIVLLTPLLLI